MDVWRAKPLRAEPPAACPSRMRSGGAASARGMIVAAKIIRRRGGLCGPARCVVLGSRAAYDGAAASPQKPGQEKK